MAIDMGSAVAYLNLDTSNFDTGIKMSQLKLEGIGGKVLGIGRNIATGIAAVSAATVAGLVAIGKSSVETGIQFDSSMSQVAATMGKTTDEIQDLSDFALEMGANTVFSASQAADALNYMALAGYDANKSMSMLPNVLNLAAAGGIELARASDMITDAESALGLNTKEVTELVDQMAKTASSSNTSVAQLGDAILTIGGTANLMAGGTDRLNTVLGILADNGIKGAEAGTHLRNILLALVNDEGKAGEAMKELGLEVFDAQGNMRDMQDIVADLGASLDKLTEEERIKYTSTLFNPRDIAAVNALLNTTTERWDELGDKIVESAGAAEQMANTQLDNLAGDITLFQSALEGTQITISRSLTPTIRKFVQFGTNELGKFNRAFQQNGFKGLAQQVGKSLSDAIKMASSYIPQVIDVGYEFASSFITSIAENLPNLASRIARAVPTFFSKVGKFFEKELPNVVGNIGKAIGELFANSGKLLSAGAKLVSSIVRGAIDAIPSFITGIIDGLENGLSDAEYNVSEYVQSIRDKIDSMTTAMDGLDDSLASINGKQYEAEHWIEVFDNFSNKANRSKSETELLNTAVERLNELFPELNLSIDENTGAWNLNTEQIRDNIAALQDKARAEAYTQTAAEIYKEIAALELERKKQDESKSAALSRKQTLEDEVGATYDLMMAILDLQAEYSDGEISASEYTNAVSKLIPDATIESVSDIDNALAELDRKWKDRKKDLQEATDTYEELAAGVGEYDKAIEGLEEDVNWLYEEGVKLTKKATGDMSDSYADAADSARSSGAAAGEAYVDATIEEMLKGAPRIRSVANSIVDFKSGFAGATRSIAAYSAGLDFVPRTMDVTVHRGERILTAEENEEYNKGGSIEVVSYQNDEAINTLNGTMNEVLDAVRDLRNMQILLDSKRVVGGLVKEIDKQLGVRKAQAARG